MEIILKTLQEEQKISPIPKVDKKSLFNLTIGVQ